MSGSGIRSKSPSWQRPNCVRHASHPNVLQELLNCFQGIDGTIVKFDNCTGFTIRNEVCFEQSHMVYQFLELGFLYHSVKKLMECQRDCMVSRGLAAVVQAKLDDCYVYIANLHSSQCQQDSQERGVDLVVLTSVLPWARQKMLILQFVTTILEETKDMIGGAILNPILKHLPHGNPVLRENFEQHLSGASLPLFHLIWNWIFMGTIKDHFNEFFVIENTEYSRTNAWQCQFTLRKLKFGWRSSKLHFIGPQEVGQFYPNIPQDSGDNSLVTVMLHENELVPKSLDVMSAKLILDVGKSMRFINKYLPEKALEFSAAKKELFDARKSDLSAFVTDDGKPVLSLRMMYMECSELVLNIMKTKYRLRDFFTQLHEYIFLTQGHFATYFMDLMQPYLYKTVTEVAPSHLDKLLHKAIKACSTTPLDPSVYENIEVHYNELSEEEFVADVFALRYKMDGPIKIMFEIFELSYRKLFMFLWKKNNMMYKMANTWKLMRTLFKTKNLPSAIHQGLQNLFAVNFQLMRFMYQLDFYIRYEVIGRYAKVFFDKLESIRTIDEVVDAHAKMLRFILLETLLEDHEDIGVQLTNIFSLVPEIEELTMELFLSLENVGEKLLINEDKHVFNARVHILVKNNETAIKNFITFLRSCKHADGLNAVCDRLNFNEFYQPETPHSADFDF